MTTTTDPQEFEVALDDFAETKDVRCFGPKYGGKDHSGYETLMKYEVNDERSDACYIGARWARSWVLANDPVVLRMAKVLERHTCEANEPCDWCRALDAYRESVKEKT